MAAAPRLPDGARLLHVGPHKTGSTAIQSALHQAREELLAQGVRYLSRDQHEATVARFATGRLLESQNAASAERRWRRLVSEWREDSPELRVFSSEFLSDATDEQVERILTELGTERTHVVVTLRPLAQILRSQYQQYLHRGETFTWGSWLDAMFNQPPYIEPTPTFWQRHRHDELIRRWTSGIGPDRVVVVMLDRDDYAFAPRTFEELLGLAPGTLAGKDVTENRSMTWAEAEMVRRFNLHYEEFGYSEELHRYLMHGVGTYSKARRPGPDEPSITPPAWAVRRANEVGAEMAAAIEALGVRVVGDLTRMSTVALPGSDPAPPDTIDLDVAARLLAGAALGARRAVARAEGRRGRRRRREPAEPPPVAHELRRRLSVRGLRRR